MKGHLSFHDQKYPTGVTPASGKMLLSCPEALKKMWIINRNVIDISHKITKGFRVRAEHA